MEGIKWSSGGPQSPSRRWVWCSFVQAAGLDTSLVGPARPAAPKCAEGGLGLALPEPPAGCRRWKQPREPPQPHPATSAPPRPPCLLFQGSGAALCSEGTELPGARSPPGVGTGARGRWAPEVIPEVIWGGGGGSGGCSSQPSASAARGGPRRLLSRLTRG